MRDKRVREKETLAKKASEVASHKESAGEAIKEGIRRKYIREMQLDDSFAQYPSPLRREWSLAQGRLIENTIMDEKEQLELATNEVELEIA